jgi:hypothetical protein
VKSTGLISYEAAKDMFQDNRFYKLVAFPTTPPETLLDGSDLANVKSNRVFMAGLKTIIDHESKREPAWDF